MRYDNVVFCGIGGSATAGDIISSLGLKVPFEVVREKLPSYVTKKSLVFIVSYSGNTQETLKLYNQAKTKKAKIIVVTSGGKLGKVRDEKIMLEKGKLPRESLLDVLKPVLKILGVVVRNVKFSENDKKLVEQVAKKLRNKFTVIYAGSEELKPVAYRWQTMLNENAKVLTHSNYFPELVHNEIEAIGNNQVILLVDKETRQIRKAQKYLKLIEIKLKGKRLIDKMMYGILFGDLVSLSLAKLLNRDYKQIKKIDYLKT